MKEYIPTSLREQPTEGNFRKESWGIGIKDEDGNYGMKYGPYFSEGEVLDEIGEKGDRLIHFKSNGKSEEIGRWHTDRWILKEK